MHGSVWTRSVWASLLMLVVAGLLGACATESDGAALGPLGAGQLGDACAKTEDCASGLCVRVDAAGGICTQSCGGDGECPVADNWACATGEDVPLAVCACRKLAERELCEDGIDNDCDARVDDCRICGGVAVPDDDPLNCGGCGVVCPTAQTCRDGACVCADRALVQCGQFCVDTATNQGNCGACGVVCPPAQSCVAGTCGCPEAERDDYCENWGCVDLATDPSHCGGCGTVCRPGQACVSGSCECEGTTGSDYCDGFGCVDLASSSDHCGTCGQACTMARSCIGGECVCPDATADDYCDGVGCVDLDSNPSHCGECGVTCPSPKTCSDGECVCPSGTSECDGRCVDTATDQSHCGDCGRTCGPLQACLGGECGCASFGYSVCDESCSPLATDRANCGACGRACGVGEICQNGECICPSGLRCGGACVSADDGLNCGSCGRICDDGQYCAQGECHCYGAGLTACGASCVDLYGDEAHCLSCGAACRSGETCSSGCSCPAGATFCQGANACVDLRSDAANCGVCGEACRQGEICSNGLCRCPTSSSIFCATENACVETSVNADHCGACDNVCNPGQICRFGGCTCPGFNQAFCASENTCVDVLSNPEHCGTCDVRCPNGAQCASGRCVCEQSGLTLCGDACFDLTSDEAHCGSCANRCSGNYVCVASQCRCDEPATGAAVRVTTSAANDTWPSAAWNGTRVGLAYASTSPSGTTNVRFALLNPNGSVVSDTALTAYVEGSVSERPSLVWSGSEFALVWVRRGLDVVELSFLRLDAAGAPKGTPLVVASSAVTWAIGEPAIAWNPVYAGYGVLYASEWPSSRIVFRRIGIAGSTAEPENEVAAAVFQAVNLAVAPDGVWGAASGGNLTLDLTLFNLDGSRTLPLQHLSSNAVYFGSRWPAMLHDGATWATAWLDNSAGDLMLNRGAATNTPERILRTAIGRVGEPVLALAGSTLAIGWTERAGSSGSYRFRMQRFALPATNSSRVTPIHAPVDILPTHNVSELGHVALVGTGANLLGVWGDDRWGIAREIYAAPVDLGGCP